MGLESWLKIELYRWGEDVILVLVFVVPIRKSNPPCDFFFVTNF